jgi:type IV pilus assembly protein PilX
MKKSFTTSPARPRQRGVVVVFSLIALVLLLLGAVAIMRSMGAAQFSIGNLGFKRDMTNQGERALVQVLADFNTGALSTALARESSLPTANYSAIRLATNAQGLPLALLGNDTDFATIGAVGKDITTDVGVTVRYVIDRLSTAVGPCGPDTCVMATESIPGGSFSEWNNAQNNNGVGGVGASPPQPVYRLTVRVTGPRGTQSFFQSTFTI